MTGGGGLDGGVDAGATIGGRRRRASDAHRAHPDRWLRLGPDRAPQCAEQWKQRREQHMVARGREVGAALVDLEIVDKYLEEVARRDRAG